MEFCFANTDVDCGKCAYNECDGNCVDGLIKDALDYINRQKAEIDRLKKANQSLVEHLKKSRKQLQTSKAEAIKEALSRVETELGEYYMAKHLVVGTVLDKVRKEMAGDVG